MSGSATRGRRRLLTSAIAFAASCSVAGAALAAGTAGIGQPTLFHARFTTLRAGASSGLLLQTRGALPAAGVSEAPALRETVLLPAGTRVMLGVAPQCAASAAQISAMGAERACPAASRIGHGSADGVLAGAPVHFDLGIYAVRGTLVFAAEQHGKPLDQSFTGVVRGRRIVLDVPTLGGKIEPTAFMASIARGAGSRAWLRTPAGCPASGMWTSVGTFQGVSAASAMAAPDTAAMRRVDHERCVR